MAVCLKCLQCGNMAKCKINDMDVVPDSRAIGSIIITAIDAQMWMAAYSHLCYIRHQIVWRALWIFANTSRFVGANWIEISQ